MKILMVHESYQQPGGEDVSVGADIELLRSHGHDVIEYRRHNRDVNSHGAIQLGLTTVWSQSSYRELHALVIREKPEIVHFHNTFPLISPSGLWAAKRAGARVVQTLRNYRLACPNALFFRNGHVCEACLHWPVPLPGIVHGCYRHNRLATAAVAAMLMTHRTIRTWHRAVDVFVVLTKFQKGKLAAGGFPESKMMIRPNFISPDPGPGPGDGGYALFAGRLTREKGVRTLLKAWTALGLPIPLLVAGGGPLEHDIRFATETNPSVTYLGPQQHEHVIELMKKAACLVFPSEWYETFGRTIIEAFAVGTPVVAATGGAAEELIQHGSTGALFPSGDAEALAEAVSGIVGKRDLYQTMRAACRREYLEKYTAERAYDRLLDAYHTASGGQPKQSAS